MSGLAELSRRIARLREISSIMTAMKNLSLVETHKLARFIGHQHRMLAAVEDTIADFLHFHPPGPVAAPRGVLLLLVGAERGFCGAFNERVLAALDMLPAWPQPVACVAVGQRLGGKLRALAPPGLRILTCLDGPTVTEEVPAVLGRVMNTLRRVGQRVGSADAAVYCLAHDAEGEPRLTRVLPLPELPPPPYTQPPRIQLPPAELLVALLDQYLIACLHGLLYASLAAESHQRLAHMEHAIDRLDETLARLALRRNALRQERIIEEIEVMLASEQAFV